MLADDSVEATVYLFGERIYRWREIEVELVEGDTAMLDAALSGSTLPAQAQARVRENLTLAGDAEPPADASRVIETAIKAEADYLAAVAPTAPRGLGFNAARGGVTTSESYVNPWGRKIEKGA